HEEVAPQQGHQTTKKVGSYQILDRNAYSRGQMYSVKIGVVVGITKRENNWITNFPTTLLKDKPEYHLIPVQECLLLQIKEIDRAECKLVKSQNFTEK
ncbi:41694_t:CDS:2, partial [Gigaspora margarita]